METRGLQRKYKAGNVRQTTAPAFEFAIPRTPSGSSIAIHDGGGLQAGIQPKAGLFARMMQKLFGRRAA